MGRLPPTVALQRLSTMIREQAASDRADSSHFSCGCVSKDCNRPYYCVQSPCSRAGESHMLSANMSGKPDLQDSKFHFLYCVVNGVKKALDMDMLLGPCIDCIYVWRYCGVCRAGSERLHAPGARELEQCGKVALLRTGSISH